MAQEDRIQPMIHMPPLRPFQAGDVLALVFPFYLFWNKGRTANLYYPVLARKAGNTLELGALDPVDASQDLGIRAPVESPDSLVAVSLEKLYALAAKSTRNVYSKGYDMRGILVLSPPPWSNTTFPANATGSNWLVALLFKGDLPKNPVIHLIIGSLTLSGSSKAADQYRIAILLVHDASEACPRPLNAIKLLKSGGSTFVLDRGDLCCYEVYPAKSVRGNKFYAKRLTLILSPRSTGILPGSLVDILAGSFFIGNEGTRLVGSGNCSNRTYSLPSPSFLSPPPGGKWHDNALTWRANRVPVLRVEIPDEAIRRVRSVVSNQIEAGLARLAGYGLLARQRHMLVVGEDLLREVLRSVRSLYRAGRSGNYPDDIKDLLESLEDLADLARQIGAAVEFNVLGPPAGGGSVYADPKLIAKALLSEPVSYSVLRGALHSIAGSVSKIARSVSALRLSYVASIEGYLADTVRGAGIGGKKVDYMLARISFTPLKHHALIFWALRSELKRRLSPAPSSWSPRDQAETDTGLVVVAWSILAAARALGEMKRRSSMSKLGLNASQIGETTGYYASLAGAHALAHIAGQVLAEWLGESDPYRYMRETTRLYVSSKRFLSDPYIINGALLVANGHSDGADISVAVGREGLYDAVKPRVSSLPVRSLADLCGFYRRLAGGQGGGACIGQWLRSARPFAHRLYMSPALRNHVTTVLEGFSPISGSWDSYATATYYPPQETATSILEQSAQFTGLNPDKLKAYVAQAVREGLPPCYDACEMCVMSDECPVVPSPAQQLIISRSAGHLLCP